MAAPAPQRHLAAEVKIATHKEEMDQFCSHTLMAIAHASETLRVLPHFHDFPIHLKKCAMGFIDTRGYNRSFPLKK